MIEIIKAVLGLLVLAAAFFAAQTKNIKNMLIFQILSNGFGMLNFVISGNFSACGIHLVAVLQAVVFLIIRAKEIKEPRWLYIVIFASYIASSLVSFKVISDLFPLGAAILCGLALAQKKPSNYRLTTLFNGVLWITYDLIVKAYSMLPAHAFVFISALIGIIRLDILKKNHD